MTSPDDQLDGIFSQIAAQDQVDPAVFDQTLDAAFEYTGPGFDDLIPETESTLADDTDDLTDDLFVGDTTEDLDSDGPDTDDPGDSDFTDHNDYSDHTGLDDHTGYSDHTGGDDLLS